MFLSSHSTSVERDQGKCNEFGLLGCVSYNGNFVIRFIISGSVPYFSCNFGWTEKYRSLFRGLRYEGIHCIGAYCILNLLRHPDFQEVDLKNNNQKKLF